VVATRCLDAGAQHSKNEGTTVATAHEVSPESELVRAVLPSLRRLAFRFFAIASAIREALPACGTPIEYRRSANKYSQETAEKFPGRPGRLKPPITRLPKK